MSSERERERERVAVVCFRFFLFLLPPNDCNPHVDLNDYSDAHFDFVFSLPMYEYRSQARLQGSSEFRMRMRGGGIKQQQLAALRQGVTVVEERFCVSK